MSTIECYPVNSWGMSTIECYSVSLINTCKDHPHLWAMLHWTEKNYLWLASLPLVTHPKTPVEGYGLIQEWLSTPWLVSMNGWVRPGLFPWMIEYVLACFRVWSSTPWLVSMNGWVRPGLSPWMVEYALACLHEWLSTPSPVSMNVWVRPGLFTWMLPPNYGARVNHGNRVIVLSLTIIFLHHAT